MLECLEVQLNVGCDKRRV